MFQFHYPLPEFTVLEKVLMPGRRAGDGPAELRPRAEALLALLGLQGLEGKGADDLSGGQKQRVAVARALMDRPALVLADEPTGNRDTVNTATGYDLFRTINRESGTAFLIVTQDRSVAQRTDRILEIRDARLVQDVRAAYPEAVVGGPAQRAASTHKAVPAAQPESPPAADASS